jgi:hypothetical protein
MQYSTQVNQCGSAILEEIKAGGRTHVQEGGTSVENAMHIQKPRLSITWG